MNRKFLMFAFALLSSTLYSVAQDDFYSDGIRYGIEDDSTVYVIHLGDINDYAPKDDADKYEGDIIIPSSVSYNGVEYHVQGIYSYAFYKCDNLTSITISDGVNYIFDYAFAGCSNLTSVNIPNSISTVDAHAFENTAWYNAQPDGVVYIGKVAYQYKGTMAQNTSIVITDGTVSITEFAFERYSNLVSIEIPSTVTSIGAYAFYGCTKLASISVPESVTNIGIKAFEATAWYNAQPDGIIYIGSMLYGHKGENSVGDTLVVKDGIKIINRQSVTRQSRLKALIIPEGVMVIGVESFYHCENLDSVSLPNSLILLSPFAFSECVKLESITLPQNLLYIGYGSFESCNKLMSIRSMAVVPPLLLEGAFSSTVYENAVLYVPAESVNAYKNADGWNQFRNIQGVATNVNLIGNDNIAVRYYDLSGKMIDAPQNGLNIIKYNNGQTRKVFIEE